VNHSLYVPCNPMKCSELAWVQAAGISRQSGVRKIALDRFHLLKPHLKEAGRFAARNQGSHIIHGG
jgi:hypothetical protein